MTKFNWESFEKWLNYLNDQEICSTSHETFLNSPEVQKLLDKRKQLENQKVKFQSACEKTILSEYRNLKKAHREFMKSINEAHNSIHNGNPNSISMHN